MFSFIFDVIFDGIIGFFIDLIFPEVSPAQRRKIGWIILLVLVLALGIIIVYAYQKGLH